MSADVVVIAEASPAGLTPASVKTISFARRLADATGEGLRVLIPGCFPETAPIAAKDSTLTASGGNMTARAVASVSVGVANNIGVFPPPGREKSNMSGKEGKGSISPPAGRGNSTSDVDNENENVARFLERTGGAETILISGESLAAYSAEAWMEALAPLCRELHPRFLCLPHTSRGWDYGPGLAIRLEAALIGAVDGFRREEADGAFLFRRSILKGQWQQEVRPERWPVVLTVLPEAAAAAGAVSHSDAAPDDTKAQANAAGDTRGETGSGPQGTNLSLSSPRHAPVRTPPATFSSSSPSRTAFYAAPAAPDPRCRPLGKLPAGEAAYDFSTAEVIVAAGQGIGAAENLALIERLAGLFPKAAVGCSRAVCDRGWMEYRRQIGMTGRTVAPPLYIACGISGAMPHLAGMRDSRCIVAVNRDKNAAIFQVAHLGIVADLLAFIPAVLEQTEEEARRAD